MWYVWCVTLNETMQIQKRQGSPLHILSVFRYVWCVTLSETMGTLKVKNRHPCKPCLPILIYSARSVYFMHKLATIALVFQDLGPWSREGWHNQSSQRKRRTTARPSALEAKLSSVRTPRNDRKRCTSKREGNKNRVESEWSSWKNQISNDICSSTEEDSKANLTPSRNLIT